MKRNTTGKDIVTAVLFVVSIVSIILATAALTWSAFAYHHQNEELSHLQKEVEQLKSIIFPSAMSDFNHTKLAEMVSEHIHKLEVRMQESLDNIQGRLNNALTKIAELESELRSANKAWEKLETVKANKTYVDSLSHNFTILVSQKADQTELAVLASNLSTHTIEIASLESELSTITAALEGLETTKASKSDLDSLSDNFTLLVSQKADQTELAVLATNLSTLEATTVRTSRFDYWVANINAEVSDIESRKANRDEVVRLAEDLAALADSALNGSHYDQLSRDIEMLAVNTASNVSSLREGIETLNETKAPRVDFLSLVLNVTTLSRTFNGLVVTVESLEATKADQTSLNSLTDNVGQLAATAAKQSDLHTLHNTVTSHINSATTTQNQHSSEIRDINRKMSTNSDNIADNSRDITDIRDTLDSSASAFTAQLPIILLTLSVVISFSIF